MKSIKKIALTALMTSAGLTIMAGSAAAQQCGNAYTVQAGDSLSAIADRVYGSPGKFSIIYSANSNAIGANPGVIDVGLRLEIPCLDGGSAVSTADASNIRTEPTTEMLPLPDSGTIRFVVGTDWAPFTNEDQDQGGMVVEITNVAMGQATGNPDYQIDFINDWGAHLQPLISDHAYDFSLAWFRPNCDIVERLGDGSKFRCNNLGWSDPLFEQIFGYYTRADGLRPTTHAELMGTTICRPAGYAMFQLEEHNLVEPNVTMVRAESPAACFQGLVDGTYDVVALASDVADGAIQGLSATDDVFFNEGLSQVLTMHAVISNTHPRMQDYLDTLNSGITRIKESGEWFDIVRRHMTEHRAKTSS